MFLNWKKLAKVLVFVSLIFSVSSVFAEDENWFWGKPISQIAFQGLNSVKKSDVLSITNNFIGKSFTEDVYNEMLDRLYSLAYFEEVEPFAKHDPSNKDKVLLVFSVKEHPQISSITFRGNKKIRNNELREAIALKAGDIYIENNVLMDERAIRDLYIKKGYMNAKIINTKEETPSGIEVIFQINEGGSTVISSIQFKGNTVASDKTLKGKLSLKEAGFLKDGAFQKSKLETDRQAIVMYYTSKGYIDARVLDVIQDVVYNEKKERDEMTLTFIIQEGAQYTYNGIKITGNEIFSTEKLESFIKLKKGSVFNQVKFQEGLSGITNLYYENGFMENQFYPSINKDPERKTVSYDLAITERSRSHIENIIIKGNTKTKDNVILRELPFASGDVFSRDKVMQGLRNLYNTQYFSSIVPEPVSGSESNLVDLVISVEEQSTISLQFGMTFSGIENPDDLPIALFAKWQNSNLKGEGRSISIGANVATTEQSVDFSYGQNWLFNKPIQFSESLSFSHYNTSVLTASFVNGGYLDDDYYYTKLQSWGGSLNSSFGRRWLPSFAILTVSGGMTNSLSTNIYNENMYIPLDLGISKNANRLGLKNALFASISLDNRDINYDPSTGWFINERVAWYGLIPGLEQEFYFRTDTKLESYLKLFDIPLFNNFWNFKAVLACFTQFTGIFPVPGSLFGDSSKVYIDGMFNARGWTSIYNDQKARGKSMFSNRVELRIPIFQGVIGLDAFFDACAVKDTVENMFTALKLDDFYFSFGPGLRFLVPQFPLHLLFANCFRVIDGNVQWGETWKFVLSFNMTNK